MKIIPKYQRGGDFSRFFNVYSPLDYNYPEPRRERLERHGDDESSDKDEKGKLTEKDLFTLLKEVDGLPNETLALFNSFAETLQRARDLGEGGIDDIAAMYLSNVSKLSLLKFNKELFLHAYDRAVAAGNLNDYAIAINGNIIVLNEKGEITSFKPTEWAKVRSSGKYSPLTNSNLLYLRHNDPNYINNNKILEIVENGIGLNEIDKMIRGSIMNIGSITTSNETYLPKEAAEGIKALLAMIGYGPDGFYKWTQEHSTNELQITAALQYVYTMLPNNAKARLALETKDGKQSSVKNVIYALLAGQIDISNKSSVSYVGKSGKGDDENGPVGDNVDLTVAARWLNGGGSNEMFTINMGDNNYTSVLGNTMPLTGRGDSNLGINATLLQASEGSYSGILDWTNIIIGGVPVSSVSANLIILRDGNITMIDFPCTRVNGRIVPIIDSETRKKKDSAEKEIKSRKIDLNNKASIQKNYQTINAIYQKYGLPARYDHTGNINNSSWSSFGLIHVAISGDIADGLPKGVVEKLSDHDAKTVLSILENNNKGIKFDKDIYKSIAWIPVKASTSAAMAGAKVKPIEEQHNILMDQARLTQQQLMMGRQPQM